MNEEPEELDAVQALVHDNDQRLQALAALGIGVGGLEHVTIVTFFEHILRALSSEEAVRACKLDLATRISNILDPAEKQAEKMREQMESHQRMQRLGLSTVGPRPGPQGAVPPDGMGPSPLAR